MARIAHIHPANQWSREAFFRHVDREEQQEVRAVAAYDAPIDRPMIRNQVLGAILAYSIPAGNA